MGKPFPISLFHPKTIVSGFNGPSLAISFSMRPSSSSLLLHFFASSSFPSSSQSPLFLLQFSRFSTSSTSSFHSSSSSKRLDVDSRDVKVSVWWDFENCHLPAGVNVFKVSHLITSALRFNGIKGPVQITAFGDVLQLSRTNQEALSATGINLTHVPQGGKNSADRSLLVDLMYWVSQNPPPAHLLLISSDRDFASILHRLRMNNYNILLASTEKAPGVLCSAASIMWHWNALIKGETLVGKCFNQPPDGRFGSWYNQHKGLLEDPYTAMEQPSYSRVEELPEPDSELKLRPIPKAVVKQIRQILKSYPKGVSLWELRSELAKSNVSIDKDFYGYNRFYRFLCSMPQILKLQPSGDGQCVVLAVNMRSIEPLESSRGTSSETFGDTNSNGHYVSLPREDFKQSSPLGKSERESSVSSAPEPSTIETSKTSQSDCEVRNVVGGQDVSGNLPPISGQDSVSGVGFLRKVWKKWFSEDDSGTVNKSGSLPDNSYGAAGTSKKENHNHAENHSSTEKCMEKKVEEKDLKSKSQDDHLVYALPSSELVVKDEEKTSTKSGIIVRARKWFGFWASGCSDKVSDQSSAQPNEEKYQSGHQLLSDNSFWHDLESFMKTPKASVLISGSKTREEMAQNLQQEGPSALKLLGNCVLLDLVDLVIADKKWVEENPSHILPFKLTLSGQKSGCEGSIHGSTQLRSIFTNTPAKPNLQRSLRSDPDKNNKNELQTVLAKNRSAERSSSEILGDCQKLVNEVLKEHPQGYNMSFFRNLFWERYGYHLHVKSLGYKKLASMLETLPGVKVESSFIFPSSHSPACVPFDEKKELDHTMANSEGESSDSLRKDDDLDSPWEELGPIASSSFRRNNEEKVGRRGGKATEKLSRVEYESPFSDNYLSDSEEESLSARSTEKMKEREEEENSSLLQILDLWYNRKEGLDKKEDKRENSDGMIDCSANNFMSSGSSETGDINVTSTGVNGNGRENSDGMIDFSADNFKPSGTGNKSETNGRKGRPQKSYSFVLDPDENNKEKLIDGIIDSLKKSNESKLRH